MAMIFFDMDGVLVDSEPHWKSLEREYLQSLIPDFDESVLEVTLGRSMKDSYALLVDRFSPRISWEEFSGYYHQQAPEVYGRRAQLLSGAQKVVGGLAGVGFGLAVVSSSPLEWIKMVLERFSLGSFFSQLVSAEELDGPGKPDPGVYLEAVRRFGVCPEQCLAIEDSEKGIRSARQAGVSVIALSNGSNEEQDFAEANLVVGGLSEITLRLLKEEFGLSPDGA